MSIFSKQILRTEEGVWRTQLPIWAYACAIALFLGAGVLAYFDGAKRVPGLAFIPAALAAGAMVQSLLERRRYHRLGKPLVSVSGGHLIFGLEACPEVKVDLSTMRKLVVYGPEGRRIYRAVGDDGTHVETRPEWRSNEEREVIAYLEATLGPLVVVESPQTAFAAVRGDGPYHDA